MTVEQMIVRIRAKYANLSEEFFTEDRMVEFVNDALGAISTLRGMKEDAKLVYPFSNIKTDTLASASDYTLPTDYIRAYRLALVGSEDIYPISPSEENDHSITASNKAYYYIVGNKMYFTKPVTGSIKLFYFNIHPISDKSQVLDVFLNGYESIIEDHVLSQLKISDDGDPESNVYFQKYIIGINDILGRAFKIHQERVGIDLTGDQLSLKRIRNRIRNKYRGTVVFNNDHINQLINEALYAISYFDGVPEKSKNIYPFSKVYQEAIASDLTSFDLPDDIIHTYKVRSTSLGKDLDPVNVEDQDDIDELHEKIEQRLEKKLKESGVKNCIVFVSGPNIELNSL